MAIAITNATDIGKVAGGASEQSISVTLDGSVEDLIVAITFDQTTSQSYASFTYNSVALTELGKIEGGVGRPIYLYRLNAPATGSNTLFIDWDFGTPCAGVAFGLSGVSSFGVVDTDAADSGTSTSIAPASSVGDTVIGFCSVNNAGTITDGQTNIDESVGFGVGLSASQKAGAASTTSMSWTHSSTFHSGIGLALTPAASGLTIDSTDASMQRDTNFQVVCSTPTTTPTTGNTTLTNGNDTLTPTSVTGSDPYTLTFPVGDLTKQVDGTGYDWTLEITP